MLAYNVTLLVYVIITVREKAYSSIKIITEFIIERTKQILVNNALFSNWLYVVL